jgi:hypothetical protein
MPDPIELSNRLAAVLALVHLSSPLSYRAQHVAHICTPTWFRRNGGTVLKQSWQSFRTVTPC